MSMLWTGLAKRGLEPSIPVKFAIALIGVGAGFLFLVLGSTFAGPATTSRSALWWLAGLYLIHSLAELCISPVGLQHDHQAVDRARRRPDDGRVVPVDLGRAICRGRRRPVRQRRDGRRAGHQPQGQPRHLYRRPSRPSPGSRSAPAWFCSCSPGRFRSGCTVSNKALGAALAAALHRPFRLRGARAPSPSRRRRSASTRIPIPRPTSAIPAF